MSQKTNPTSLRLQKTSQNFCFPWFADYFWNETYQTCFESQKYITDFLKETSFSKALFSAKVFYKKLPFFLFLHDNRVAKKEKLFFFKKPIAFSFVNHRKSPLSKKIRTKDIRFSINNKKTNTFFSESSLSLFYPMLLSKEKSKSTLSCSFKDHLLSKDLRLIKRLVRDDYLKIKLGFFYSLPYILWDNKVKANLINSIVISQANRKQEHKKALFERKISNTYYFLPKQSVTRYPKIFVRPCLSFCENIMSPMFAKQTKRNILSSDNTKAFGIISQNFKQNNAKQNITNRERDNLSIYNMGFIYKQKANNKVDMHRYTCNTNIKTPFFPTSITVEPIRFLREHQNVLALADIIISLLEKRISFRQIKSLLFKNLLLDPQIKGLRISCSGRLGGRSKKAQKAKVQSDSCGATTLATFSSKILFASKSAYTSYGKVGIKIWLSFEDKRCTQL